MSLLKRISKSLVEGNALRKVGPFIRKRFSRDYRRGKLISLDRKIGYAYRKCYARSIKVVPNSIFFFTFQGMYTCNPKYISEELERRNADVKIYWALKNTKDINGFDDNTRVVPVKINTIEYYHAAMSSKFLVTNAILGDRNYMLPVKRNQICIQTWHGSLGIKRFDPKSYNSSKEWPIAMAKTAKMTKYCISNSQFEDDVYRETYWPKTEILRFGHARNDVFFELGEKHKQEWLDEIKERFNIEAEDPHFVLYAPTFRDDHNFKVYDIDFEMLLETLTEKYGGTWYLLLRYHPSVLTEKKAKKVFESEYILNVTEYTDIQQLMVIADIGISDYSSWMFDFMLSRKPVFVYAKDLNYYKVERNFYYPIESTPFPVARNNKQLKDNLINFDQQKYIADVEKFLLDKGCMEDGHAAKRIVDFILQIIEDEKKKRK